MAAHGWRSHRPLNDQVLEEYGDFDYYQLVRLGRRMLEDTHGQSKAPDKAPALPWDTLGDQTRPWDHEQEADARLRVKSDLNAGFGGFEFSKLLWHRRSDGQPEDITLSSPNYCVGGSSGPLPAPFTEWTRELQRDGDHAMADFLDLFNRRVHLWRWRIKSSLHPGLQNQHPDHGDYASYLASLIGLLDPELVEHLPVPRRTLLGLTGLLIDNRRSAPAIEKTLAILLGAEVKLEPMQGRWMDIDRDQTNRLGNTNSRLGQDSVIGRQWFDPQAAIGINVAPLPYKQVCPLLPEGDRHHMLCDLLRLLTERRVDVWVCLQIADTPPPQELHAPNRNEFRCGPRLGYTSALTGEQAEQAEPGEPHKIRFFMPAFQQEPQQESRQEQHA